jgi:hypothetical protein
VVAYHFLWLLRAGEDYVATVKRLEEEMNHYEIATAVAELRRASTEGTAGELSAAIDAIVPAACIDHYVALQELADLAGARAYEAQTCLNADGIGHMAHAHALVRLEADHRVYNKLDTLAKKAKARANYINKTGVVEE